MKPHLPPAALALAAGLILAAVPASAQMLPGGPGGQPTDINADQAIEWHQDVKAYVARGNASAKRGETTLYGDVLTAYYRESPGKGNEVFQIVSDGHVRLISPTQQVYGDHLVYDMDKQVAVVTGKDLKLITPTDVVTARDTLEYYESQGFAVARGEAVAVRTDRRLRADVLIGQFSKGPDGKSQMNRIDGSGSVVVTTPTDVARSDKLVYSVPDNTAVLLGSVHITRGDNQLDGDAAEMNMATKVNRVIAGPATGGRVKGLLIPNDLQAESSPPAPAKSGAGR
ncbi:LptA/OstA family protein [Azospirillum sp. sgz301742]